MRQPDLQGKVIALLPRLRRLAQNVPDADDLVQKACVHAVARADHFKPGRRLDALRQADRLAARRLAQVLDDPVPLARVRALAPKPEAAPPPVSQAPAPGARPRMPLAAAARAGALAAGVALVAVLPAVPPPAVAQAHGWTEEVVAHRRIHPREGRHLVEVGAGEPDHIRAWLGDRIARPFDIPDLSACGLTVRGARLPVAAGKPGAQLVCTLEDGSVVAL